ncbi:MAG TPA: EF-hand domain-containing protein [Phycisphaerae bacterium]|nr:EF-hand domain-containing protein [Phycisphaerae bacterium]HRY70374.1 EF-hand domain-containing protein [Phycisphaerae bacterium]HSA28091.1 EF-hand domain-containing protein [Phycisphaerae bacterium]
MFHRLCAGVGVFLVGLMGPSDAWAGNLLANPGFETPIGLDAQPVAQWTEFGDPSTRWVTQRVTPYSGGQVLKMFGPWDIWGGTGVTQVFAAAEGQTWIARVYARNDSSDPMGVGNFCVMKIEFLDAVMGPVGGTWLAGVNVYEVWVADEATPRDEWLGFGLGTAPAPAGTAFAQLVLVEVQGPPVDGGSVFLDDAFFSQLCGMHDPVFDVNDDGFVDAQDLDAFVACYTGPAIPLGDTVAPDCKCLDRNGDNAIDQQDFGLFQRCYSAVEAVDPACDG